jgi:hypothetical protein
VYDVARGEAMLFCPFLFRKEERNCVSAATSRLCALNIPGVSKSIAKKGPNLLKCII